MTDRQKLLIVENAGIRSGANFFMKRSFISFAATLEKVTTRILKGDIHEIAGSRYDDRSFSASRHSKEQRCSIHAPDSGFLLFVESANIEFLAKSVVIQCSAPPNFYIYIIPHISLIVNSFQKS